MFCNPALIRFVQITFRGCPMQNMAQKAQKHRKSTLHEAVLQLISNRRVVQTYKVISIETGVPVQFIQDLMGDRVQEPSLARLEKLYFYFSKEPFTIAPPL